MLPANPTIVGIDERTALVIDPLQATGQVMGGPGNVTIVRAGRERSFPTGQTFDLGELGPFGQLSDPGVNIPTEVWNRVPDCSDRSSTARKRGAGTVQ